MFLRITQIQNLNTKQLIENHLIDVRENPARTVLGLIENVSIVGNAEAVTTYNVGVRKTPEGP